jgi:hypothetical protein
MGAAAMTASSALMARIEAIAVSDGRIAKSTRSPWRTPWCASASRMRVTRAVSAA